MLAKELKEHIWIYDDFSWILESTDIDVLYNLSKDTEEVMRELSSKFDPRSRDYVDSGRKRKALSKIYDRALELNNMAEDRYYAIF